MAVSCGSMALSREKMRALRGGKSVFSKLKNSSKFILDMIKVTFAVILVLSTPKNCAEMNI